MNSDFLDLLRLLNAAKVKYLVIGGYAYSFYAEPRYTKDLDIWIACNRANARKIHQALKKFGAPVDNISAHDFEQPGLIYIFGLAPVRIDILNSISRASFETMYKNKNSYLIEKVTVPVVSKQDLITLKKIANRPQDKLDIKTLKLMS